MLDASKIALDASKIGFRARERRRPSISRLSPVLFICLYDLYYCIIVFANYANCIVLLNMSTCLSYIVMIAC